MKHPNHEYTHLLLCLILYELTDWSVWMILAVLLLVLVLLHYWIEYLDIKIKRLKRKP